MNLPNWLTVIRFILIPIMTIFLLQRNFSVAIVLYVLASVTDILDGHIARKYNQITKLGKILDPMADKLLQFSALVGLWILAIIPWWITFIFFLKELFMGLGCLKLLKKKDVVMQSKWFGKMSTIVFFLAIVASMLEPSFPVLNAYILPLFIIALLCLLFSFIMYLCGYLKVSK